MSAALESEANAMYPFQNKDHKAWAKRIIYRAAHGDKDLLLVQVKFARMAMDIKDEVAA